MCRKLVNHFLFAALLLHSFPSARQWCCPNNLRSTSGVTQGPSPLLAAGGCAVARTVRCVLCAGAGTGTGLQGAGQDQCPTQPCPFLQTCTRVIAVTQWCRWLEEPHCLFDAADNKWLEGRGSLKFLSRLTWRVDFHCSPIHGTSAVLTPTQKAVEVEPRMSQLQ